MSAVTFYYIPVPSRETGAELARTVLAESLAACGNLLGPMTSIYEWKQEICEEEEYALILKTDPGREKELRARLLELHPYDCPCISGWEAQANTDFSDWVREQTV